MTQTIADRAIVVPGSQLDVSAVLHALRIAEEQFRKDADVFAKSAVLAASDRQRAVFEGMKQEFERYVERCDHVQRVLGAASTGTARLVLVAHYTEDADEVAADIAAALEDS